LLPAGHALAPHAGRPHYAPIVAGAVSADRPDYLHVDGLERMDSRAAENGQSTSQYLNAIM
jgi:hypothetical protein